MACASKLECNLLMKQLVKQLAIPLSNQKTVAKWLVIAIRLGYQPKNFWPGTRKTITKSLVMMKQLAIRLGYQLKNFWPGTRKALHSHLTKLANYANQVIG